MRVLIYNSRNRNSLPLQRVVRQVGLHVDHAQSEEHLAYLSNTEQYLAVIVLFGGSADELVALFTAWKAAGGRLPFVVLTRNQSVLERARLLELGAWRYYIEPYSYARLLEEVILEAYQQGGQRGELYRTARFELDPLARSASCDGRPLCLTRKEFDLLALLIRHRGSALSRVQIWEDVWGYESYPLANTVDVHINRLRKKISCQGRIIVTVHGIGYRMHENA